MNEQFIVIITNENNQKRYYGPFDSLTHIQAFIDSWGYNYYVIVPLHKGEF